ncbi:hypothetical protein LMXM_08_29_1335 [Leishmania mexicana MHOM/GT/2001/U1103]|uniref:Uncharacterized protein n=1 Tax=Leishmania mexicana (strain MHOM/GT/2001/U1103) TaxID=929439 RepID=E9ALT9_LEIMU|nr:hypothetical protein LMXM_08_29_1335 [Leishmania mexicana MHOM/GT/2001/U1103]CBZ23894.1 hypothetical protein LMXM_08_29_1335 [Leishmania mexicana MHOM/GT/2001/U1103]
MPLNIVSSPLSFTVATCVLRHSASVCSVLVGSFLFSPPFFSYPQSSPLLFESNTRKAQQEQQKKRKPATKRLDPPVPPPPLLCSSPSSSLARNRILTDSFSFFLFPFVCACADRVLDLQSPVPCSPHTGCTGYPLLSPSTRIHPHPIHISFPLLSFPTYPFIKPFAHLSVSVSFTSFYFVSFFCGFPLPLLVLQQIHAFDSRLLRGCLSPPPPSLKKKICSAARRYDS